MSSYLPTLSPEFWRFRWRNTAHITSYLVHALGATKRWWTSFHTSSQSFSGSVSGIAACLLYIAVSCRLSRNCNWISAVVGERLPWKALWHSLTRFSACSEARVGPEPHLAKT